MINPLVRPIGTQFGNTQTPILVLKCTHFGTQRVFFLLNSNIKLATNDIISQGKDLLGKVISSY